MPYIEKVLQEENLLVNQKALLIMDIFSGQITSVVLDCFNDNEIEVVCVPANMAYLLQPQQWMVMLKSLQGGSSVNGILLRS